MENVNGRWFPEEKISAIQGDWRYFQCSRRCHDELYDSVETLHKLKDSIDADLRVPSELIPRCPKCGAEMEPWVRSWVFLEGKKYQEEYSKLHAFLKKNMQKKVLFLELGVGARNQMIKAPFMKLAYSEPNAFYITFNKGEVYILPQIQDRAMGVDGDLAAILPEIAARFR